MKNDEMFIVGKMIHRNLQALGTNLLLEREKYDRITKFGIITS